MLEPENDAWARIRYAYEHTDQPIGDICIEHGVSSGTLRDRMRRWGWKKRRPPIPREGPPAAAPLRLADASRSDPPHHFAGRGIDPAALPVLACATDHPTPKVFADAQTVNPPPPGEGVRDTCVAELHAASAFDPEADAAAIVPRLRSASARVLPAIEATIARLAAGAQHPREMEQASRALGALTRTLHELNTLLSQHNARAAGDDEPIDMDELRNTLAQRLHALINSCSQNEEEAKEEET